MSKKASVKIVYAPEPPPGPLGTFSVMTIALGSQLGIGLISFLPLAISSMGTRAVIAMVSVILLTVIYSLPLFFVCSTARISAGVAGFVCAVTKNPYVIGVIQMTAFFLPLYMAIFGLGFAAYLGIIIPGINKVLAAAAIITVFYVFNMLGSKWMARLQNIMFQVLMIGLGVYIVVALIHGDFSRLAPSNPGFSVNGNQGLITGSFVLFAMSFGYNSITQLGRVAKDAKKNITHGYIICVAALLVLFTLMCVATSIVVPFSEIGDTLVPVAFGMFPPWLFYVWMIAVPGLLIATSINGFFSIVTESLDLSAVQGWLPHSWARTDKKGTKWILLTIIYVMAMIPVVTGWSLSDMASYFQFITFIAEMVGFYYLFKLPTKWKKYWEQSKFHVPNGVLYTTIVLAMLIKSAMLVIATTTMKPAYIVFTVCYIFVALIWIMFRLRTGKAQIVVGCWSDGINVADPDVVAASTGKPSKSCAAKMEAFELK